MNPNHAIFVVLLCIGAATAFETFTFGERQAGDRPLYFETLETNETNPEVGLPFVYYEWFGVNQTFTHVYVEASSWTWAGLTQPGNIFPLYERTFELEVAGFNPNHLTVSFIVFGFVNQPPTHPGAIIPVPRAAETKVIERKTNSAVYKI